MGLLYILFETSSRTISSNQEEKSSNIVNGRSVEEEVELLDYHDGIRNADDDYFDVVYDEAQL